MSKQYEKLKTLLKELFQLDQPDLDFGLYRIMRARSAEITQFLDKDLLPQVKASFAAYQPADKADIQKELDKVINAVKEADMDPEQSPKVKELRAKLANEAVDIGTLESEVYDHLYSFFRRYYSEGDFISKRVYKEGVYAIPYEGEEVKLHWANADQYYIKTSEYLRDYAFRLNPANEADPKRVHFRLADAAEGEHGNVKEAEGKNRMFVLAADNFLQEEVKELVIRFEYRPATLTDWPEDQRAGKTKPPAQKDLIAIAEKRILAVSDSVFASWIGDLGKKHVKADGEAADYSKLAAHLNRYTARNTFDYFIHKDLSTFLNRELDFYIKNEVMHLDDVESETAPRVEQYLSKIKVIRKIAKKIIDFLAQLEDFQKKLWLKKKFVVETNYCITLDRVPEEFYPEIAANTAQVEEWVKLGFLEENVTTKSTESTKNEKDLFGVSADRKLYASDVSVEFLKANDKLVLDTKFFSDDFKAKLIGGIENFDDQMDGLLIHSENFQALNLLQARYREQVKTIYIDPPYNTSASEILYKNSYKHSSWLSLISNSLQYSKQLLNIENGVLCGTIDDAEQKVFSQLLEECYLSLAGTVAIRIKPSGRPIPNGFAISHEYAIFAKCTDDFSIDRLEHNVEQKERYKENDSKGSFFWELFRKAGSNSNRINRPTMYYPFFMNKITYSLRIPKISFNMMKQEYDILELPSKDEMIIFPEKDDGSEGNWYFGLERAKEVENEFKAIEQENGKIKIYYRRRPNDGVQPTTLWFDSKYSATEHGTALLKSIFGKQEIFSYPKSIYAVEDCLTVTGINQFIACIILDYFAGSGTTGHAVINLNREDDGKRKFILVEMGDYFDTVLKPRIQKVIYSSDWKDGKPTARDTGISHCFKYLRLESYEDTLNNLDLRRTKEQAALLDFNGEGADAFKEDYILRYMMDVESRGSASLLNIEAFFDPTAYSLKVKIPGSDESREVNVDLVETFNYLLGLQIKNISAPHCMTAEFERDSEKRLRVKGRITEKTDGKWWFRTVTGTTLDGRKILVIWRKRPGLEKAEGVEQDNLVLDEWFKKMGYSSRDSEFDTIYVNGTNNLENLKTPDDLWKVRLIEEDFARLMFEDTGV